MPRRLLVLCLALAASTLSLVPSAGAARAAAGKSTSGMSARSLGTAHNGSTTSASITVDDVAPAANRLLALWVVHRRADGTAASQEILGVSGLGLEWRKELHTVHATNLTRFALFSAATGGSAPTPGPVTIAFSTQATRINVIVIEVAGADLSEDGAHAITNLVSHEGFDNTTSRTHHLEAFIDPARNATLAFHMVGRRPEGYQKIAVEAGMRRVAMVLGGDLTSAAAFAPRAELSPTFSWPLPKSNGGLAVELRAPGTPPERAVERRSLTQGTEGATSVTSTAPVEPTPGALVVAFVANGRSKGFPGMPSLDATNTGPWALVDTAAFDTAATPLKRLSVLVAEAISGVPGPIEIRFSRVQDRVAWGVIELDGVDLSAGPRGAVRQADVRAVDTASEVEASLSGFGSPESATVAAVAFDSSVAAVPEEGYAIALSTATRLPVATGDLRLWGQWRASPETTPATTLSAPADAAMVAFEVSALRT